MKRSTDRLRPSLKQRLTVYLLGRYFLRDEMREGWKAPLSIYLVKCAKHGYFEDYQHGFDQRFDCPICLSEWQEK
jgi:hypothetical protein